MSLKVTSLIKPYLSIIDNGSLFRKPISWLYVTLAAVSILASFYLIYTAISLNTTYFNKENNKSKFEVFAAQFEKTRVAYDTISTKYNEQMQSVQNAYQNYAQQNQTAENYRSYLAYGSYYAQEYQNAKNEADQWFSTWEALEKENQVLAKKLEVLKPAFEKGMKQYNNLDAEYQDAINNYDWKRPEGAFHASNSKVLSVIALVLFCIFILIIGLINALVLWSRSVDLKQLNTENDKFTAIPVLSHFIQTMGEYISTYIATMGFATVLIAVAFKTCFGVFGLNELYTIDLEQLSRNYEMGIPYLLVPIIAAFFMLWTSKIIAEAIKTLVAIANNTQKTIEEE
jgi:hypothetical protein